MSCKFDDVQLRMSFNKFEGLDCRGRCTLPSQFECEVIDAERLKHNGLVTFGGVDRPRSAIARIVWW